MINSLKAFSLWVIKAIFLVAPLAVLIVALCFLCGVSFGAVRRNPPRYKVAPTNVVERIDGTNCWIRYMYDTLLKTNLVVMIEPFDPAPAPQTNDFIEVGNE